MYLGYLHIFARAFERCSTWILEQIKYKWPIVVLNFLASAANTILFDPMTIPGVIHWTQAQDNLEVFTTVHFEIKYIQDFVVRTITLRLKFYLRKRLFKAKKKFHLFTFWKYHQAHLNLPPWRLYSAEVFQILMSGTPNGPLRMLYLLGRPIRPPNPELLLPEVGWLKGFWCFGWQRLIKVCNVIKSRVTYEMIMEKG